MLWLYLIIIIQEIENLTFHTEKLPPSFSLIVPINKKKGGYI